MNAPEPNGKPVIIIRIRGRVDVPSKVEYIAKDVRIERKFNASIYPYTHSLAGKLMILNSIATWGEIDEYTLYRLLSKRLERAKGERASEEYLKKNLGLTLRDLVSEIMKGSTLSKYKEHLLPYLRLHPPSGGFKGKINSPYSNGGELGYRGEKIKELVMKMM
jgi:large subunit ribosomal protein L30